MGRAQRRWERVEQPLGQGQPLAHAALLHPTAALGQGRLGVEGIQQVQQPWRPLAGSSSHPLHCH